ncbi:MAG: PEP-CTERM sorting domain-containing protein [Verrucomicrobiota bacterium]
MKKKTQIKPVEQLDRMLDAYDETTRADGSPGRGRTPTALTLASSAIAAASAMQAHAVPVYVNMSVNLNQSITGPGVFANTTQVDLNLDGFADITLGLYGNHGAFGLGTVVLQASASIRPIVTNQVVLAGPPNQVNPFLNGSLIGGGGSSVTTMPGLFLSNQALFNTMNSTTIVPPPVFITSSGLWGASLTRFAGVRFLDNMAQMHWAWLRFHVGVDANGLVNSLTLQDWAYESDPLAPITAGAGQTNVPEPDTAALLGLGLLAVGARGIKRFREIREDEAKLGSRIFLFSRLFLPVIND